MRVCVRELVYTLYFLCMFFSCCCTSAWEETLQRVTAGGPTPSGKERVEREAAVAMATPPCGSESGGAKPQPAERARAERMTERQN